MFTDNYSRRAGIELPSWTCCDLFLQCRLVFSRCQQSCRKFKSAGMWTGKVREDRALELGVTTGKGTTLDCVSWTSMVFFMAIFHVCDAYASLFKLGKGTFFKAHKDTPRNAVMFSFSLCIVLHTPRERCALLLRHSSNETSFDSAAALTTTP